MCWRAFSTASADPITSNTGSRSRPGVIMYVPVSACMRLIVAPFGPTTRPTMLMGTRTPRVVVAVGAGPEERAWRCRPGLGDRRRAAVHGPPAGTLLACWRRLALICVKCSAAESISRRAASTSCWRPVTTNTGSSPRTGVLIYVFVLLRSALILQPFGTEKVTAVFIRALPIAHLNNEMR